MSSRWFGSLQNRMADSTNLSRIMPVVGMGVTEMLYSDREPYEIIEVKDERHIMVRRMHAKLVSGSCMSESQDYEYTSDPDAPSIPLFRDQKGHWRERIGRSLGCNRFVIGYAEKYYDPTF